MQKILAFALLILILTGCAPTNGATPIPTHKPMTDPPSGGNGIEGHVFLGPACPIQRIDSPCPDRPYQTTLTVNSLGGEKIVQVQTDENGYFHIPLPPGDYILHPETTGRYPSSPDQNFTVYVAEFTQITVTYDSGIR